MTHAHMHGVEDFVIAIICRSLLLRPSSLHIGDRRSMRIFDDSCVYVVSAK